VKRCEGEMTDRRRRTGGKRYREENKIEREVKIREQKMKEIEDNKK
jgi:hypothetical protein